MHESQQIFGFVPCFRSVFFCFRSANPYYIPGLRNSLGQTLDEPPPTPPKNEKNKDLTCCLSNRSFVLGNFERHDVQM